MSEGKVDSLVEIIKEYRDKVLSIEDPGDLLKLDQFAAKIEALRLSLSEASSALSRAKQEIGKNEI